MKHVVALAGDVFIDRPERHNLFDKVRPLVEDQTFWFANLESPITTAGPDRLLAQRSWTENSFSTPPQYGPELQCFTAMSLANNHCLDAGIPGYLDTIDALDRLGVGYAGGGRNRSEARSPFVTERDGLSVGFLAYTCLYGTAFVATASRAGMATVPVHTVYEPPPRVLEQPGTPPLVRTLLDEEAEREVRADIAGLKSKVDLIVVSMHWGRSNVIEVIDYQFDLGRACVDSGADIVFGHHPHVLQPLEIYRGKPIVYSLGNFVFDSPAGLGKRAAVVKCYLEDGVLTDLGIVPLVHDDNLDPILPPDEAVSTEIVDGMLPPPESGQFRARRRSGAEIVLSL